MGSASGAACRPRLEPSSEASFTARDKKLLANAPYAQAPFRWPISAIVDYHRKEAPGTILVDPDARYLYYVLPEGKAIRYGVTVGEEAHGLVRRRQGRPHAGMAALDADRGRDQRARPAAGHGRRRPGQSDGRARHLSVQGNKDTLFRIHGTNQPEYIGQAISSGCIRMTNEDVIDLYKRVKMDGTVVVLARIRATRRSTHASPRRLRADN